MGVEFAKAALAAGDAVVATGRNTDAVRTAVGQAEDLLAVHLDVTRPEDAEAAVKAAVDWSPGQEPEVAGFEPARGLCPQPA